MWLGYTVTWEDSSLPHQIVLRRHGDDAMVSCNCLHRGGQQWTPIEVRSVLTYRDAVEAYRLYHERLAVSAGQPDEGEDQECATLTAVPGMRDSSTVLRPVPRWTW